MKEPSNFSTSRLLNRAVAVWGACIILLQVVILSSVAENPFILGGAFLLLISLAAGIGLLLAPWLQRRSGYLVLVLAVLWWVGIFWFRRDDSSILVWGLVWGAIAYAVPAALLLLFSGTDRSPGLIWAIGLLAFVLIALVLLVALGTSSVGAFPLFATSALPGLEMLQRIPLRA